MENVLDQVLYSAVILNYFGLSLQFECLPNGDPIPVAPRDRPSPYSDEHKSPEKDIPPVVHSIRPRSRSAHNRFKDPPTVILSWNGTTYGLDRIELVRLISKRMPNRPFQLRRYTFPATMSLKLTAGRNKFAPIPAHEHIVPSSADSDVFAVLESCNVLAGFYGGNGKRRMKINMKSGTVTPMIKKEINEIPVGDLRPIVTYFRVESVSQNSPNSTSNGNEIYS